MTGATQDGLPEQHNHGSGTFVGRDNYGSIRNELLDPQTKTTLAKLSKDAPALASILKKALREGIISPDIVAALESAVRNINEDVAEALMLAGRNINEDVAEALTFAGQNINEKVAYKFVQANEDLSYTASELDRILLSLRETTNDLQYKSDSPYRFRSASAATSAAQRNAQAITRPSPASNNSRWFRTKLIFYSFLFGFLAGTVLIYYMIKR